MTRCCAQCQTRCVRTIILFAPTHAHREFYYLRDYSQQNHKNGAQTSRIHSLWRSFSYLAYIGVRESGTKSGVRARTYQFNFNGLLQALSSHRIIAFATNATLVRQPRPSKFAFEKIEQKKRDEIHSNGISLHNTLQSSVAKARAEEDAKWNSY